MNGVDDPGAALNPSGVGTLHTLLLLGVTEGSDNRNGNKCVQTFQQPPQTKVHPQI